jgi:hypothetical protein
MAQDRRFEVTATNAKAPQKNTRTAIETATRSAVSGLPTRNKLRNIQSNSTLVDWRATTKPATGCATIWFASQAL